MNRKRIIWLSVVAFALLLLYYLYGGSQPPASQQPLGRLNNSNLLSLKDSFNQSANCVRLLVLVSPT